MSRIRSLVLAIALLASLLAAAPGGPAPSGCTLERTGVTVTLSWTDAGGKHIVRRDGDWLATPGVGASSHVDTAAPPGATYELRTWREGVRTDTACTEGAGPDTTTSTSVVPSSTDAPTTTAPLSPDGCTATRRGTAVELRWTDAGGRHVIRRDGRWMTTIEGGDSWTDDSAPVGAIYEVRVWLRGARTDTECVFAGVPTTTTSNLLPQGPATRVLHVSIDALRTDHVNAALAPNLADMIATGASTLNARTDHHLTKTLPNHTSQYTGRPVWGSDGHRVDFNADNLQTVDLVAGVTVDSVFDVVDGRGGHTAVFAGKTKFDFLRRSWSDAIDTYRRGDPSALVGDAIASLRLGSGPVFVSYHIRLPDSAGHASGWSSAEYDDAVRAADAILGRLLDAIEADGSLAGSTAVIVTSDHGGPDVGLLHDDATQRTNYTVPFIVWGAGVPGRADLYSLNSATRAEPGSGRPGNAGTQPIRGHDMANLALDLLGLQAIPGSVFNATQDLRVG